MKLDESETPIPPAFEEKRVRLNVEIDEFLWKECQQTVNALSDPPHRMTMDDFVDDALRRQIIRLRNLYNEGTPFSSTAE